MNFIGQRLLAALLAVACVVATTTDTFAAKITAEATFMMREGQSVFGGADVVVGPPIWDIISLSSGDSAGGFLSNTYGVNPDGSVDVRSVGATILQSPLPSNTGGSSPQVFDAVSADGTGNLVVIFALRGTADATSTEDVMEGKAVIIDTNTFFGFDLHDPKTWAWADDGGIMLDDSTIQGIYTLALPSSVTPGPNGDNVAVAQGDMNELGFRDDDPFTREIKGDLLFDFTGTPTTSNLDPDSFHVGEYHEGGVGDPGPHTIALGGDIEEGRLAARGSEGLYIEVGAQVEVNPQVQMDGPQGMDGTSQSIVNDIYMELLGMEFADFGSFTVADYFLNNFPQDSPDFFAQFNFIARPILNVDVPEPATAMLGLLGLGGLVMGRRRRNRA